MHCNAMVRVTKNTLITPLVGRCTYTVEFVNSAFHLKSGVAGAILQTAVVLVALTNI